MSKLLLPAASGSARQLPWTSVDVRDLCGWNMEDGQLLGKRPKIPKRKKLGRGGEIIDSVSFRGRQWTSAMCVGGRWKHVNYYKNERKRPKLKKLGRGDKIIASVIYRQLP